MIQHYQIDMNSFCWKQKWDIFQFVFINIIKNTVNGGTCILFFVCMAFGLYFNYNIIFLLLAVYIGVYILLSIEETYHIIMLIILEKKDTLDCLDVTCTRIGLIKLLGGACVRYKGKFKKSDLLYISIAGPIMPLLIMVILLIAINIIQMVFFINMKIIITIIGICTFTPIVSFVPISFNGFESDGYKIFKICKESKITVSQMIQILNYVVRVLLKPAFLNNDFYN